MQAMTFNPIAVDFLLDDTFQLWLLELNSYPWMSYETNKDKIWMEELVKEMIDIEIEIQKNGCDGMRASDLINPRKWKDLLNMDDQNYTECPAKTMTQ